MKRTPLPPRKRPLKRSAIKRVPKGATTIERMLGEGLIGRASSLQRKQKPIRKRAKNNKGWWDVALEIWAIRPHICSVCRRELGDEPDPHYFSHLLPRGSYRLYKRDPRNIILKCRAHHDQWHEMGPDYLKDHWEWSGVCAIYYELRDEANGVSESG